MTTASGGGETRECCDVADARIARHFDRRMRDSEATGELPRLFATSRLILAALRRAAATGPRVLELGCGSGALTVALVEAGAAHGHGMDLSPASVEVARRRSAGAGLDERLTFEMGDGAMAVLEPHDWVILDRVLCCYRDLDRLLGNASWAARSRLAFSVPESRGWRGLLNRAIATLENVTNSFRGRPCPGFVHDIDRIDGFLSAAGFHRVHEARTGLWRVAIVERDAARRDGTLGGEVA
jgi:SAM-dependent methyltransferase